VITQDDSCTSAEGRVRGERLLFKYIESGGLNMAGFECLSQRSRVQHWPACRVDQDDSRPHPGHCLPADEVSGFRQERHMQREVVGLAGQAWQDMARHPVCTAGIDTVAVDVQGPIL